MGLDSDWFEKIFSMFCSEIWIAKTPFLKQLLKKISPNEGAITVWIPKSFKAQTACSLLEPHPKFSLAIRIFALEKASLLRTKSFLKFF